MIGVSPLRYPGGKSSMAGIFRSVRALNRIEDRPMAEPFAGGAGASLALLFSGDTPKVLINDADPAIRDLWNSITNRSDEFQSLLRSTRINMTEWRRQRLRYLEPKGSSAISRGFSAFYLNRCNRSGIIRNGGPIGGVQQRGKWKLGARFNKPALIRRCERISGHSDRIRISGQDGIEFIRRHKNREVFFFIDPPYYHKGPLLYLNGLTDSYHARLARVLRSLPRSCAWVLTYDDCPEVRSLYRDWARIRPFSLRYTARERKLGGEVLIAPRWMRLPRHQTSASIRW